ncbi:MAG: hypothetical protein IJW24_00090, partial [Clostridia bacterium]|nr:hypothetical protein [Clostridia bacterium]
FNIDEEGKKCGFYLWEKSLYYLFGIGNDIWLSKKNKNQGRCYHYGFDYKGIENALCGKYGRDNPFTIKRFLFIQMK